ncbi:hypothetical protein RFI_15371 [Reticulomyxa filosa]|uniref:Uncharacterized protein n=1 Tax=Reticulomyxa filosa TaxID=46433 RepID=X6N722_RETFI|nr:hypothetical protein RFI_15371 [Reticulomyxa filosa]|eukprot:ETO21831.1 hypothetical protein RFI_15371 [Reticulomyxa filosa]
MTFALGTILSQLYSHAFLYLDEKYARPHYLKMYKKQLVTPDTNAVIKTSDPKLESVRVAGSATSSSPPDFGDGGKAPLLDQQDADVQGVYNYEVDLVKNVDTGSGGTGMELQKKRRLSTGDSVDMFFDRSFLRESRFEVSKHPWNERILPFAYRYMPKSLFGIGVRSVFLVAMLFNCWATYSRWALGSDAHRAYTTWDVLTKMATCTDYKTNAYLLGIVYFITVMFMPACTTIICLLVWWFPSNYYVHRFLSHCVLPFMAWSSMDVFTVASMAAAVELSQVSEWIINQNFAEACGPQGFVVELTHQQCFSVQGSVTWGCYLVGGTSICLWAIAIYTVVQMNRAQREIERKQPKHHRPVVWRV